MRYLDYFIKCIIRRIVRLLFKPKILICILILLLVLTLFLYNESYCAESSIYDVYSSFNNQLINVIDKAPADSPFYFYFNDSYYSFYVYFGSTLGSDMFTDNYNASKINVAFYPSSLSFTSFENTVKWAGINCSQGSVHTSSDPIRVFSFDDKGEYSISEIDTLYLPRELYNYRSPVLSDYLREQKNVQEITGSVKEGTDKVTNSINDTNNFLKDDTVSDDSMNIDTSSFTTEGEKEVDNFFTKLLDTVYKSYTGINSEVSTVIIPLPYDLEPLVLKSDIISKHIKGTLLYNLIQVFWTYFFGSYLVIFVKRIFDWLSTGKIADKGVFSFIEWLDINNEIIKSYMM